jgi:hypothetical protein
MSYQCAICKRSYRQKFNYDRHIVCCEFLHKSSKQHDYEADMEEDTIPSPRAMYQLMQEMSRKIVKLEATVNKLQQNQRKKIDVIAWLNEQEKQPDQTFHCWIKSVVYPRIKDALEVVYATDLLKGCKELFKLALSDCNNKHDIPVRAFENKENHLYIYVENPTLSKHHWLKITNTELDRILDRLDEQFILNFRLHWYEPNKDKMDKEMYKELYVRNYAKVLGTERMSDSKRHSQIGQYLYSLLKQPVKSCVEF